MSLTILPAADVLAQLDSYDTVIDARSEDEYADDHLPGAVNWPTLNNAERILIGTLYKQVNQFEAKKRGAALAARNIAAHIEREVIDKPRDWKPLTYCWRGGKRSGSLSLILDQIGFRVTLVEGGYKAFRAAMLQDIPNHVARLNFRVVCGTTGSGKTRLLHALAAQGAQVLDLEGLARHKGSMLGAVPGQDQPTQKAFETQMATVIEGFDLSQPVFVEAESRKIGRLSLPTSLVERMRASPCIEIVAPDEARVTFLLRDYAYLGDDGAALAERLDPLRTLHGHETVNRWQAWAKASNLPPLFEELTRLHYDPLYARSQALHFHQWEARQPLHSEVLDEAGIQQLAQAMLAQLTPLSPLSESP